jgi:hypothetical protein
MPHPVYGKNPVFMDVERRTREAIARNDWDAVARIGAELYDERAEREQFNDE